MKATLVNCAVKTSRGQSGNRVPQGCMYLLAAAEEAGLHVDFRDYQTVESESALQGESFADFMEDDSDVVAVSCMSNVLPMVLEGAEIFKSRHPRKKVVLGGIGPSGVAPDLMDAFPQIDVIAPGEGEDTFPDLLTALDKGRPLSTVDGLFHRAQDGGWRKTRPRPRLRRLDRLPPPAYHRVDMSRYETVGIQTARGCPFPCSFCDVSSYWGRKTTYRSIDPVMRELDELENRYGFDRVTLLDDTFILNRKRVREFCRRWREDGLKIRWSAYCRIDLLDDEIISWLGASGCYRVFLGVESGSNRVLRRIGKALDFDHLASVVKKMSGQMIVRTSLIWGFPFETLEDLKETVLLLFYLIDLGCDASLALLSPLPLSRLYGEKKDTLILREELQSSVVSSRCFRPGGESLLDGKPSRQVEMIRRHPDVFPGFYIFEDPQFERKLAYLHSMGLEIEKLSRP